MNQFTVDRFEVIKIDYESNDLPATIKLFKPVIFKDGRAYCCLLGPDPQVGIFGCGHSVKEALEDWDQIFNQELASHSNREGIIQFIRRKLAQVKEGIE